MKCSNCLYVLPVGLSAKISTKPLDFLIEAKRSEEINKLWNKYLHRKGATTFFPRSS